MRVAVGLFIVGLALYIPWLAVHHDRDGLREALAVESARPAFIFDSNHLLFRPAGWVAWRAAATFGYDGRVLPVLQLISAVFAALTISFQYLVCCNLTRSRALALLGALGLAVSSATWYQATNCSYITVASAAVAGTLAWFTAHRGRPVRPLFYLVTAALCSTAILAWKANVFLLPGLLLGLPWLGITKDRLRVVAWGAVLVVETVAISMAVFVAGGLARGLAPSAFLAWMTQHRVELPTWGQWSWERGLVLAKACLAGLVHPGVWRPASAICLLFLAATTAMAIFRCCQSRHATKVLWPFVCLLIYCPFLAWWAPADEKWPAVLAVFFWMFVAQAWRHAKAGVLVALFLAVSIGIAAPSFFGVVYPRHVEEGEEQQMARCIDAHMAPGDRLLLVDWKWRNFLQYSWNRPVGLIQGIRARQPDEAAFWRAISREIRLASSKRNRLLIVDIDSLPAHRLKWIQTTTRLSIADLRRLQGPVAFSCRGVAFREVPLDLDPALLPEPE